MVKPTALWAHFKTCPDSKWLGDICRRLGGQEVALDFGQQQVYNSIMMDSEWMDQRIQEKREKDAEKHRKWREKRDKSRRKQVVKQVLEDIAKLSPASPVTEGDAGDIGGSTVVTSHPSIHPSIRPSIRPSVHPSGSEDRTDADTDSEPDARACAGRAEAAGPESDSDSDSASESAAVRSMMMEAAKAGKAARPNPWRWEDDEIRYTQDWDTRSILSFALGRGAWAKAVKQAGDEAVRELFVQFRGEVRAGETPDNPAAAFTRRLARDLGVDFSAK